MMENAGSIYKSLGIYMISIRKNTCQLITSVSMCVSILMLFGYFIDIYFVKYNIKLAIDFILSGHFLFFVVVGILLYQKRVSGKWYDILIFVSAALYTLISYGNNLDVFRMAGDNICQIAYWEILFHQNLAGAIGASFTKPGQLLVLGIIYDLSIYFGPLWFKVGLCLVMATCIWSLVRVATDIGGRAAGMIAFPLTVWTLASEFLDGSSSIFLIPSLFAGIWLYCYKPDYRNIGRVLLVCSIQFHIHTIAVLGAIWLIHLIKRDWRELKIFSLYSVLSVVFWVAIIYRVQGSIARINSGAAVGYVAPLEGIPDNPLLYMWNIVQDGFVSQVYVRTLVVLGVIGVIGSIRYGYKMYLAVFPSLIVFIVNVVALGSTFNMERFCSTFYAFSCAVGVGTFVRYAGDIKVTGTVASKICLVLTIILMAITFDSSRFNISGILMPGDYGDYVVSASKLLTDRIIQNSSELMTEDDILYPLVVLKPDRFTSLTALQNFNVVGIEKRKEFLSRTEYIWIALTGGHEYYYMNHLPVPEWSTDPFRLMIFDILTTAQAKSIYGFSFEPIDINHDRLILRVGTSQPVR